MVFLMGCSLLTGCRGGKDVIMTIDDQEYTLQDMMYIIYAVEESYNYQAAFGYDIWNLEDESGKTGEVLAKEEVKDQFIWVTLLSEKAIEAGYSLSEEEQSDIDESKDSILESLSEEYQKRTGFTEDNLQIAMENYILAYNYYNDQLEKVEIDEDEITASINQEDYHGYEIEYICVPTVEWDSEGNASELSESEVKEAKKTATSMMEEAKSGTDFETIVGDDEINEYGSMTLTKNDESLDEKVVNAALTLKNDEMYGTIIEAADGYYIIKMINNNSTQAYDEAVTNAINEEKTNGYDVIYQDMLSKRKIKMNDDEWDKIVIHNYAYENVEYDDEDYYDYYGYDETEEELEGDTGSFLHPDLMKE